MVDVLDGPYLQAALFCQVAIHATDNTISIIRAVDRIIVVRPEGGRVEDSDPAVFSGFLVVMLKAGSFRGRGQVAVTVHRPNGEVREGPISSEIELTEDDNGVNAVFEIEIKFGSEGVYWFEIAFADRPLTRIPMRVSVSHAALPPARLQGVL